VPQSIAEGDDNRCEVMRTSNTRRRACFAAP